MTFLDGSEDGDVDVRVKDPPDVDDDVPPTPPDDIGPDGPMLRLTLGLSITVETKEESSSRKVGKEDDQSKGKSNEKKDQRRKCVEVRFRKNRE